MKHLHRTVIAIVAALGLLFVGVAVAQDVPEPEPLPATTEQECVFMSGAWFYGECFDAEALLAWLDQEGLLGEEAPVPAQPAPATQSQPQYTG